MLVYIFYGHLVFLWPDGVFCDYLVYFSRFGIFYQENSGNPVRTFGLFHIFLSPLVKNAIFCA
jgi:hypothetical protein